MAENGPQQDSGDQFFRLEDRSDECRGRARQLLGELLEIECSSNADAVLLKAATICLRSVTKLVGSVTEVQIHLKRLQADFDDEDTFDIHALDDFRRYVWQTRSQLKLKLDPVIEESHCFYDTGLVSEHRRITDETALAVNAFSSDVQTLATDCIDKLVSRHNLDCEGHVLNEKISRLKALRLEDRLTHHTLIQPMLDQVCAAARDAECEMRRLRGRATTFKGKLTEAVQRLELACTAHADNPNATD